MGRIRYAVLVLTLHLTLVSFPGEARAAELVAGSRISAWNIQHASGPRVTLALSAYNLTDRDLRDVLIADAFPAGVSVIASTPAGSVRGDERLWALGTVPAQDVRGVEVLLDVSGLAPGSPIDEGMRAVGGYYLTPVTASAPPVPAEDVEALRDYLQPTMDANFTDPFVARQAALLQHDLDLIVDFMADDVGFELYEGSLRGARGTIWSAAGNALDQASLMIALLRASGIPSRYAEGEIDLDAAQELLQSLFAPSQAANGAVADYVPVADPVSDATLQAEARRHAWVEYWRDGEWRPLDPAHPGANLAAAPYLSPATTYAEIPGDRRHQVRVVLRTQEVSTAFGGFPIKTVMDVTLNSVETVGVPVTVAHAIRRYQGGGIIFPYIAQEYRPFVALGGDVRQGTAFEERWGAGAGALVENFLVAEWLQVEIREPNGRVESFERPLFDRNTYVQRVNGDLLPLSYYQQNKPALPALSELDFFTLLLPVSRTDPAILAEMRRETEELQVDLEAIAPFLEGIDESDPTPAEERLLFDANILSSAAATMVTRVVGSYFVFLGDAFADAAAKSYGVRAYESKPRLIIVQSRFEDDALRLRLDNRQADVRVLVEPGQAAFVDHLYRLTRGRMEGAIEGVAVAQALQGGREFVPSTVAVFEAAATQDIPTRILDSPGEVGALAISEEAKIRVGEALAADRVVHIPVESPLIDGLPAIAWWETDPYSGLTYAVTEDGGHQVAIQYAGLLNGSANFVSGVVVGGLVGSSNITLSFLGSFLGGLNQGLSPAAAIGAAKRGAAASAATDCAGVIGPGYAEAVDLALNVRDIPSFQEYVVRAIQRAAQNVIAGAAGGFGKGFNIGQCVGEAATVAWLNDVFQGDPAIPPFRLDIHVFDMAEGVPGGEVAITPVPVGTALTGAVRPDLLQAAGHLDIRFTPTHPVGLTVLRLDLAGAQMRDASGNIVADGAFTILPGNGQALLVAADEAGLSGTGTVTVYPGEPQVAAHFDAFTGFASGGIEIWLDGPLKLNNADRPAKRYLIMADALTMTGSGSAAPMDNHDSISLSLTNALLGVGASADALQADGAPLAIAGGIGIATYTGDIVLNADESFTFDGTFGGYLGLAVDPTTLNSVNNGIFALTPEGRSNFVTSARLAAVGPPGWTARQLPNGAVRYDQPADLGAGVYPLRLFAEAEGMPGLVAQAAATATVSFVATGIDIELGHRPLRHLNEGGRRWPGVFEFSVRGRSPATRDVAVSVIDAPSGSAALVRDRFTVAGTGVVHGDVYYRPGENLPAPGTVIALEVRAEEVGNPLRFDTDRAEFTVGEIKTAQLSVAQPNLYTARSGNLPVALTTRNTGNMAATVVLEVVAPAGFTRVFNPPGLLSVNQSHTQDLVLGVNSNAPGQEGIFIVRARIDGHVVDTLGIRVRVLRSGAAAAAYGASESAFSRSLFELWAALAGAGAALDVLEADLSQTPARDAVIAAIEAIVLLLPDAFESIAESLGDVAERMADQTGAELSGELVELAALFEELRVALLALVAYIGDLNDDGRVDYVDLFLLMTNWRLSPPDSFLADLNRDQITDAADLLEFVRIRETGERIPIYYTPVPTATPTRTPTVTPVPPTATPTPPPGSTPTPTPEGTLTPTPTATPDSSPKTFVLRGRVENAAGDRLPGEAVFLGVEPEGSLTGFANPVALCDAQGEFTYGSLTANADATFNLQVFGAPATRQDFAFADITGNEMVVVLVKQ